MLNLSKKLQNVKYFLPKLIPTFTGHGGEGKYRYTRKAVCKELPEFEMDDGAYTIFLNTKGTNEEEEPEELVKFLKFVGAKPSDSENDFDDAFVQRLQKS